jgi:DNA-binding beta-propeller fold protein YncE
VITLENNGFEIVFTPDGWNGLPPATTVVVTLIGGDAGIADQTAGKTFLGPTPGTGIIPSWTLQFNTVDGGDPLNQYARSSCYFLDDKSFGVIDISPYTVGLDPFLFPAAVGSNSRRNVGRPLDMVIDPRVDPIGDTIAYVVDANGGDIVAISTKNSRVIYRLATSVEPRGLAISPSGQRLYITEYGGDEIAKWDLAHVSPTALLVGLPGLPKFLTGIQVGRGPLGAACAPDAGTVFVVNNLEGTCSVLSQGANTVIATWQTGVYPQDVGITVSFPNLGYFALVSNQGAGDDPGSASMWWSANPDVQQWLIAGMVNPKGVTYDWGINWLVANSGSSGAAMIQLGIQGNTVVPSLVTTFASGEGPQNVALDPVSARYGFVSCRGDGLVTVFNAGDTAAYYPNISVPGVRYVATLLNQ